MTGRVQQQSISVNPDDLEDVGCGCGCKLFAQGVVVKKVPATHPMSEGHERLATLPADLICMKCGKPLMKTLSEIEDAKTSIIL
jgi:hypothetical protein